MSPRQTRRALLRTVGAASIATLTGCIKAGGPSTSEQSQAPTAGGTNSHETTAASPPTSTVTGQTYGIVVANEITEDDLEKADDRDPTTPAMLSLKAYRNPDESEDTVFFERTVELPPNSTTEFTDVFRTEPDGTQYVVMAELTNLTDGELAQRQDYSKYYRFVPGGFQYPSSDTFRATVTDVGEVTVGDVQPLVPSLSLAPV